METSEMEAETGQTGLPKGNVEVEVAAKAPSSASTSSSTQRSLRSNAADVKSEQEAKIVDDAELKDAAMSHVQAEDVPSEVESEASSSADSTITTRSTG